MPVAVLLNTHEFIAELQVCSESLEKRKFPWLAHLWNNFKQDIENYHMNRILSPFINIQTWSYQVLIEGKTLHQISALIWRKKHFYYNLTKGIVVLQVRFLLPKLQT